MNKRKKGLVVSLSIKQLSASTKGYTVVFTMPAGL